MNKKKILNIKISLRLFLYKIKHHIIDKAKFGIVGREIWLFLEFLFGLKSIQLSCCFFMLICILKYEMERLLSFSTLNTFHYAQTDINTIKYWEYIKKHINTKKFNIIDKYFFNFLQYAPWSEIFENNLFVLIVFTTFNFISFILKNTFYSILILFLISSIALLLTSQQIDIVIYFLKIFTIMPRIIFALIISNLFSLITNQDNTRLRKIMGIIIVVWESTIHILLRCRNIKNQSYIKTAINKYKIKSIKIWKNYILTSNINEFALIIPSLGNNSIMIMFLFETLNLYLQIPNLDTKHTEKTLMIPKFIFLLFTDEDYTKNSKTHFTFCITYLLLLIIYFNWLFDNISSQLLSLKAKQREKTIDTKKKIMNIQKLDDIINNQLIRYVKLENPNYNDQKS